MGKFKDYEALIGFYLKLLEEKSELLTQQVVSDQSGIIQPVVSKLVNKQFTNPKMIVNLFNYINQEFSIFVLKDEDCKYSYLIQMLNLLLEAEDTLQDMELRSNLEQIVKLIESFMVTEDETETAELEETISEMV